MQEYQYVSRKIQIAIYGIILTGKRIRKDYAVRIMSSLESGRRKWPDGNFGPVTNRVDKYELQSPNGGKDGSLKLCRIHYKGFIVTGLTAYFLKPYLLPDPRIWDSAIRLPLVQMWCSAISYHLTNSET